MAAAEASPAGSPEKAGDKDARAVTLQYRHVFGLKANVKGTVHFTEETHVLYPAGHNTILYATDQKAQTRFFSGSEGSEGISCLAVSPNRKFLAVCEKFQDRAVCSVFDVNSGKRRRGTLSYADCDAKEFVYAAFSADNKFLITQGGPPDFTLILWSWDKARPHGSVKVSNITGSTIHECSFNPLDSNSVCVVGDGVFKFFRLTDGVFKSVPNQLSKLREANNQNYVCHCWVQNQDRLVVCSESGDALLFDNGGEFRMTLPCSPQEMGSLRCIAPFSKGFVTGGDNGVIRVFEQSDDMKEWYKKTKEVKVGESSPIPLSVTALAVSPSEETLAVATSSCQLLQVSLSPSDIMKTEESAFDHILTSFHSGPILGLDVCVRKPLVVTCGIDKSVRVWNYLDKTQELYKFFGEEAYSVAFHPSGFHLIVGFSDKLRLMNVIMEDMRTYKEVPIKACKECRFSHGGQFFAAVNSNTIQIYKTYTCEVVCNLRGHQSKVRSVCWTTDDSRLVSTGADGAAYEYDIVKEGRRCHEWAQKGTNFSCIIAYTEPSTQKNTMYCVGSDKMLKEVQENYLTNYLESNVTLGQLALANSAKVLFAGVTEPELEGRQAPGPLRCYNFPLDGDYVECQAHSAPVSRIRITYDDQYLFSTGDDGCLYIFDVKKKAPSKRDKDGALGFADEILVTRAFLDDKQASLLDLERQVEELTNRIDFQLRHRDSYHKEKMAELQEKYSEEIETERRKYEVLREEKAEMEMEYEDNIKNLEETHAKQTQELEQSFQQKMLVEVQRFQKLAQDLDREKQEWETQHGQLVQGHEGVIDQMKMEFEKQQRSNWDSRDQIIKEKEFAFKQHHETLAQLERDADREIEELKEMYEEKLAQEKDEKVRLRGQAGIHRKHHDDLKRQMQKKQDDVRKEEEKNRKNEERIGALLKDKESNEKEIKERDKTITDKEQRIYDLRKQNQELEKFKFVLDYKIKELKAQIDPKNDDITSMNTQIQAMEGELDDYMRKNKQLALDISQLQMKQRALQEEIKSQKKRLRDDLALIKRFRLDLSECMECIQEPKQLKEAVANLYRKYVQSGVKKLDLDTDMQKEYNRQRDYLEKSVDSLKRKLEKDSQAHRTDNMRIMQENVQLIREINDLRREINVLKHERTAQELQTINQQAGTMGGTDKSFSQQANDAALQRDEIAQLRSHLSQLEASAPPGQTAPRPALQQQAGPAPVAPSPGAESGSGFGADSPSPAVSPAAAPDATGAPPAADAPVEEAPPDAGGDGGGGEEPAGGEGPPGAEGDAPDGGGGDE